LTELGAVLGQDMTLECCYAKLSYLLGKVYYFRINNFNLGLFN